MFHKFLKSGNKEEPGGLDYLLDNPTARLVRGSVEITRWVIDHSPSRSRQRFASGVINDLSMLDTVHDEELLDEFELMVLASRPKSSMSWCVIEHKDKEKREFHFAIARFDLLFRKWTYPYMDRIDRHAFQAWVEHFALRHDLELPSEKLRVKPAFEHLRIRGSDVDFLEMIWGLVDGWVKGGEIIFRKDLENRLTQKGYKVRCDKHKGGPLQQPVILGPDGNPLRLTNSIYYRPDFGLPGAIPLDRSDKKIVAARLAELDKIIRKWRDFRAYHSIGRFFGSAKQKGVAKGSAEKHLRRLIDERLKAERQVGPLVEQIDFNHLFRAAYHLKSGVPGSVIDPSRKAVAEAEVHEVAPEQVIKRADQSPGHSVDVTSDSADVIANPEAFQPPASGGTADTETPIQKASISPATIDDSPPL